MSRTLKLIGPDDGSVIGARGNGEGVGSGLRYSAASNDSGVPVWKKLISPPIRTQCSAQRL